MPHERAESFLALLAPQREALLGFARRALHAPSDAEDAVQTATLRAFRDFHRFSGGSFRAFAFTYLVHEVQNANRKRRPMTYGLAPAEEPALEDDALAQLEREAAYDVLLADRERVLPLLDAELAQALRALPEGEREAFLLRALGELKYAEIAATLQVPLGTVMTRLHRARARLRRALVELAADRGLLGRPATHAPGGEEGRHEV
ncbi:MAG: RNA polymerase sigma factor [Planctomycetes bacterium]|nr:RNA polymerase sigma factor [Planctomycetota bacterium]